MTDYELDKLADKVAERLAHMVKPFKVVSLKCPDCKSSLTPPANAYETYLKCSMCGSTLKIDDPTISTFNERDWYHESY